MNNKAFTFSLALALLATVMVYSYMTSKEEEWQTKYGTPTAVVVAKEDIKELETIDETKIEILKKPQQYVEPGALTSKDEVVGFIASVPLKRGEQVTLSKAMTPGLRTGLARQVSPGKRAIALSVRDDNAVGRLIKPGDRIDVLAIIQPPGQRGSDIAKLVLQDVLILAVGEYITTLPARKVQKDEMSGKVITKNLNLDRNFNTITLEVDPNSAQQVLLLQSMGMGLYVMLRNNDDTERVALGASTLPEILNSGGTRGVATQR
ncbi:MAG TPA: Flp pilus assembly protein CpaB [Oligoflexia bacterium]|nr:Flp pilus assembly protein CpaB [Oligoflexia bacterium]